VPSFATGGRRAAKAGIAAAINITVMSSTTVTSIIKRLIAPPPLPTLPTGAVAPIVAKADIALKVIRALFRYSEYAFMYPSRHTVQCRCNTL
jgi:hypothetical protein